MVFGVRGALQKLKLTLFQIHLDKVGNKNAAEDEMDDKSDAEISEDNTVPKKLSLYCESDVVAASESKASRNWTILGDIPENRAVVKKFNENSTSIYNQSYFDEQQSNSYYAHSYANEQVSYPIRDRVGHSNANYAYQDSYHEEPASTFYIILLNLEPLIQ